MVLYHLAATLELWLVLFVRVQLQLSGFSLEKLGYLFEDAPLIEHTEDEFHQCLVRMNVEQNH